MDFDITLKRNDFVTYYFDDGDFEAHDADEDDPISISGDIMIDGKKIGSLTGYELNNDKGFYICCDDFSGDLETIAATICNKTGAVNKKYLIDESGFDRIFILDNIKTDRRFRNKGIGSTIIKNLPKMLRYQFDYGSNIFLCASDFESAKKYGFDSDEYKIGCKRLVEFYKRCGYKVIKDNVMVCNTPEEF